MRQERMMGFGLRCVDSGPASVAQRDRQPAARAPQRAFIYA
jgi:hypothetical protein